MLRHAREAAARENQQQQRLDLERQEHNLLTAQLKQEIEKTQAAFKSNTSGASFSNPEYLSRFEALMKTGQYTWSGVRMALQETQQDGKFSCQRAEAHLKANQARERSQLLATANTALPDDLSIKEDSALGRFLLHHGTDSLDIVVKCKDAHARQRKKEAHCAVTAVGAANLTELACIKNDALMGRKGLQHLTEVATAVVEDCAKCLDLRKQSEAATRWKGAKAQEDSGKDKGNRGPAPARDKRKRVTIPFRVDDSIRDVRKPRTKCNGCSKGYRGGKWIYFCDECGKGYHLLCTDWMHLRSVKGGEPWFACDACVDAHEQSGDFADSRVIDVDADIEHGRAPASAEAETEEQTRITDPPGKQSQHPPSDDDDDHRHLPLAGRVPQTPPPRTQGPRTDGSDTPSGSRTGPDSGSNFQNGKQAQPNVTVKDYFLWETVPLDWAPKPDAPTKQHPERGYSKQAYQNWRRKNVAARDSVRAQGSNLGSLVRGISTEMKVIIATQFIKEPTLSHLWPFPIQSDRDIDSWVTQDPEFKWFDRITDEQLLGLLDKRFGVKKPDLFLSRKFHDNLPPTDSHGDVNYHADAFNRWAAGWQNELMDLIKSGCDFSDVDLRQTLINAVSTNKLIHQQATQHNAKSVHSLLAHLRDWVIQEEDSVLAQRNKKATLIGAAEPAQSSNQNPRAGGGTQSAVLLTQIASTLTDLAAGQEGTANRQRGPLPTHLKARDGNKVLCRGCNNEWDRKRSIPCYRECKFVEHPNFNKNYKTQDPTTRWALTWKRFREKHPGAPLPKNFLKWEAIDKARQNDPSPDPKRNKNEQHSPA